MTKGTHRPRPPSTVWSTVPVKRVAPEVFLISRPSLITENIAAYLDEVGGREWLDAPHRADQPSGEKLVEFAGRMCYRSWKPGLNKNVTRVRKDSTEYLQNVIRSEHGSVIEHAQYSFIFHNVSRVFAMELIRHRAGVGISQESMRYVRLEELPIWWPDWVEDYPEVKEEAEKLVDLMESFQFLAAEQFGIDDEGVNFHFKKKVTSWMRRFAPEGVATGLVWSANLRTLRHVIEMRTAEGAEEEIRLVFHQVATRMRQECPAIFKDYTLVPVDDSDIPAWVPGTRKA